MTQDLCPWQPPQFLFYSTDPGIPSLLYYAYVPIILITLFFCIYVFIKDRYSLRSTILLLIGTFFTAKTLNDIFEWTSVNPFAQMFSWQITAAVELPIALLAVYFIYIFFWEKRKALWVKITLALLYLPTIILLPTVLNVKQFYLTDSDCGGAYGPLMFYVYGLEFLSIFVATYLSFRAYRDAGDNQSRKNQAALLGVGSILFLGMFSLSNVSGELTKIYSINLIGPIGLTCFIAILTFLIVRYKAFNIKLIGAQALVVSIAALIGARLFYSTTTAGFILSAATFVAFLISGFFLVQSVKREIEQREHIEKLAEELQETNERQEGLLHFVGHEVKGFLTKDEGAFAALVDGDFGVLQDGMKPFVEHALAESRHGAQSVTDLLTASNQKKGTVSYLKAPFDLKAAAAEVVEKTKSLATEKGLMLAFSADDADGPYSFNGDKEKISDHVFRNLVENSLYYTPAGSVSVSLKKENGRFVFAVKDTGVGITEEDKKKLFTEGGHGKDSQKVNVHSTGYGLYIAKNIVVAHGGTIAALSAGAGKGSTFIVEFPA